jgi:hypothetical protein
LLRAMRRRMGITLSDLLVFAKQVVDSCRNVRYESVQHPA